MEYKLVWEKDGRDVALAKAAKKLNRPIPPQIANAPKVQQFDLLYWECFMDLCSSRPMGYSMGYIPWTAVNEWAYRHGVVDRDQFEMLRYVVKELDQFWVDHFQKKQEAKKEI